MERVLVEIKSLNDQMRKQKHSRAVLEDDINEAQYDRTKLE